MEVPETDEAVRAALLMVGVKPMICQEKGKKENKELTENKKRLQVVADAAGRKLVFVGGAPKTETKKPAAAAKPVSAKLAAAKKAKAATKAAPKATTKVPA